MNRDFILPGSASSGGVLVPPMGGTSQDGFEISSVPEASTIGGSNFLQAFNWNYTSGPFLQNGNTNIAVWLSTATAEVKIKLPSSKRLNMVLTSNPPSSAYSVARANLTALKGSNNDVDYDDIPFSLQGTAPIQLSVVTGAVKRYKFYKLTFTGTDEHIGINEIALIGG